MKNFLKNLRFADNCVNPSLKLETQIIGLYNTTLRNRSIFIKKSYTSLLSSFTVNIERYGTVVFNRYGHHRPKSTVFYFICRISG